MFPVQCCGVKCTCGRTPRGLWSSERADHFFDAVHGDDRVIRLPDLRHKARWKTDERLRQQSIAHAASRPLWLQRRCRRLRPRREQAFGGSGDIRRNPGDLSRAHLDESAYSCVESAVDVADGARRRRPAVRIPARLHPSQRHCISCCLVRQQAATPTQPHKRSTGQRCDPWHRDHTNETAIRRRETQPNVGSRGAPKRELVACVRTGRAPRVTLAQGTSSGLPDTL